MADPTVRLLAPGDMPAAAALQLQAYQPLFHEPQDILESRLVQAPSFCWGAFDGGELVAYILSHPWPAGSPPAIGERLSPPPPGDNWFIHDLAIGEAARGRGLGRALVRAAATAARDAGLTRGDLVAVQGAWRFWERLGYAPPVDLPPSLRAKVALYGGDARYMTVGLHDLKA